MTILEKLNADLLNLKGISDADAVTEAEEIAEKIKAYEEADDKIKALAEHLEIDDVSEIETDNGTNYEYGSQEFLVLTDEEADEEWERQLDNYLDECIYPELPDNIRNYFDDEKWKDDARFDGRGHSISSYDGEENEQKINGTDYYIYRLN
jgi:hypothetical protein